jgi:hypothetical protein
MIDGVFSFDGGELWNRFWEATSPNQLRGLSEVDSVTDTSFNEIWDWISLKQMMGVMSKACMSPNLTFPNAGASSNCQRFSYVSHRISLL